MTWQIVLLQDKSKHEKGLWKYWSDVEHNENAIVRHL